MRIAIVKETSPGEDRVAATPDTVKKLIGLGHAVTIEAGAGLAASVTDEAFVAAGATIAPTPSAALSDADLLFKVRRPSAGHGVGPAHHPRAGDGCAVLPIQSRRISSRD